MSPSSANNTSMGSDHSSPRGVGSPQSLFGGMGMVHILLFSLFLLFFYFCLKYLCNSSTYSNALATFFYQNSKDLRRVGKEEAASADSDPAETYVLFYSLASSLSFARTQKTKKRKAPNIILKTNKRNTHKTQEQSRMVPGGGGVLGGARPASSRQKGDRGF